MILVYYITSALIQTSLLVIAEPMERLAQSSDQLSEINQLYNEGQFDKALVLLNEQERSSADTAEIREMKDKVLSALADYYLKYDVSRSELDQKRMALETFEKSQVPGTYNLKRLIPGKYEPHITKPRKLQIALSKPVSIHLKAADLSAIIQALARDKNINIIADSGIGKGKSVDIELDNVPIQEVLDYVSRNFDVRFYLGENVIWATSAKAKSAAPLVTRIFQINKGIQYHGSNWDEPVGKKKNEGREQAIDILSRKATELPGGQTYLEEIINKFVSEVEGSELYLDKTTHTLFVRNTPENISVIEEILETIDISPPQVLIEARFIEVSVSDLREMGIDWQLNSDVTLSEKGIYENGVWKNVPETVISEGATISAPDSPYSVKGEGTFPGNPLEAFGMGRNWTPQSSGEGLNLTVAGILTQPEFTAIIHMLEISGKGRTLSVPRVTTLNNNPAKLRDGSDLLYYEEFEAKAFNLLDQSGNKYSASAMMPKGKPTLAELGITLIAVPSVGRDMKSISLLLTPTISKLENFQFYTDANNTNSFSLLEVKLPTIARRQIQTKVIVESGQTVVMGGLIETVEQDTEHSVPILSSIPLIGKLFTSTDVTELRKNLLIFVTATVVSERGESLMKQPVDNKIKKNTTTEQSVNSAR